MSGREKDHGEVGKRKQILADPESEEIAM